MEGAGPAAAEEAAFGNSMKLIIRDAIKFSHIHGHLEER